MSSNAWDITYYRATAHYWRLLVCLLWQADRQVAETTGPLAIGSSNGSGAALMEFATSFPAGMVRGEPSKGLRRIGAVFELDPGPCSQLSYYSAVLYIIPGLHPGSANAGRSRYEGFSLSLLFPDRGHRDFSSHEAFGAHSCREECSVALAT